MLNAIAKSIRNLLLPIALLSVPAGLEAQINTDRVMDIGRNALYFEDYVLSIQYFNQVISVKPYLCEPYFFRGLAKFNLGDYQGAEDDCTRTIDCNPFVVNAYQVRGLARINLEDYAGAIEDYRTALRYDPENIGVLHNVSLCYLQEKQYEMADSTLDYLLKVSPGYTDAYMLKSEVSLERGDTAAAFTYADTAVSRDPYDARYWSARATIRLMQEDYKDAEGDLTQAIRLGIDNAPNFINRALARYNQKDLRGAMADYDEALDLDPDNYIGLYNRGLLRAQVGDDNRAIEDFDKVLEMNPRNMMAMFNRALLRENTGDYAGAIDDYTRVLQRYPEFAYGYRRRADLYKKTGNPRLAAKDEDKLLNMALDEQFGKQTKAGDTRQTRRESDDDDVDNYEKMIVADDNNLTGYNNDYRGRIQNRNVEVRMQPMVAMTYYEQPSEIINHSLYHKAIDALNSGQGGTPKLLMTTRERPLTESEVERHFTLINSRKLDEATGHGCAEQHFRRALDFYLVQDFDSAVGDLDDAEACDGSFFPTYFLRSLINCKKIEVERSQQTAEAGLFKPEGGTGLPFHDYDTVLADLDKVVELAPDFPYAYYNRACVKAMLRDFLGALDDLGKAIELDGSFAEAYYNRGLVNVFLGNNRQGIDDLSRAGELGIASAYNVIKRFRK